MKSFKLKKRHQKWVSVGANVAGVSEEAYIHRVLEEEAIRRGIVDFVDRALNSAEKATFVAPTAARPQARKRTKPPKPKADRGLPFLHERLQIVMGTEAVSIPDLVQRLREKGPGWLPESKDLSAYLSLTLSQRKSLFERVDRGVYRVKKGAKKPSSELN